jgi:hypothetical protein
VPTPQRTFVLLIGDKPIFVLETVTQHEAQQIRYERWLLDDLRRLKSNGAALWDGRSKLKVRPALPNERDAYLAEAASARNSNDEILIVYLVELDGYPI